MDRQLLVNNIVGTARAAVAYGLPIVHSTVNVKTGLNKPPIPQLRRVLGTFPTYDRTTINSREDIEFRQAVEATGRKKLTMTALWTEACLTFPALDALGAGSEVYVVVDAVGGTSLAAHEAALRRIEQAGGKLISVAQLFCELQRDCNSGDTAIPGTPIPGTPPIPEFRGHRNSGDTILNFVPSASVLAFAGRAGGRAPPPAPRSIARRLVDGRF